MTKKRIILPESFREYGLVLHDVKITQVWGFCDCPLFGVCRVGGENFFFQDVIYDMWRCYAEDDCERMQAVYAVYDIPVMEVRALIRKFGERRKWAYELDEIASVIGIFWWYER